VHVVDRLRERAGETEGVDLSQRVLRDSSPGVAGDWRETGQPLIS
jgi:hypothetical protein